MSVFIGIDIGTSATKTLAINEQGRVLAHATHSYPCYNPRPLWSEQDPEDWWTATVATVQQVVREGNLKPADVKAIGLSGQMHGAVFLDDHNRVIRPAILWNDQRTTAECDEIESLVGGKEKVLELAANPALTGFTAPKILWLRKFEPHHWERVRKILLPKDEIRRRLTGEYATDVSDASGTLLLSVEERQWSKQMLSRLDIDIDLLPDCFESPDVTGTLTESAAELLGLSTDTIVVGGAGDCPAGAIGNGIVTGGIASTIVGTSSVVLVHSDSYHVEPEGRLHTVCHAVPGKWMMMGVNLAGGGCLQWFRNELCKEEIALTRKDPANVYLRLNSEAASVQPGCQGLIFLPYLSGERTPHNDADARGCFIGLTMSHSRGHMVRAIMEGVAYNMRESMVMIKGLDVPVNQIRVSGGGSQSQVWRQIQADMFGQQVVTVNCVQGPAYGVALLAAVGAGAFSSVEEACQSTIRVVTATGCTKGGAMYYDKTFPLFQGLYHSLKDDFKRLSSVDYEAIAELALIL